GRSLGRPPQPPARPGPAARPPRPPAPAAHRAASGRPAAGSVVVMNSEAAMEVLGWRDGHIIALDQTALPHEIRMLHLTTVGDLVGAIGRLAIRGAPVLGAAGALGGAA